MEEAFVCVRFSDKLSINEFVSIREIKYSLNDDDYIKPENCEDFEPHHEYYILWCICKTTNCSDEEKKTCIFFPGYIVCIGETLEEVEKKSAITRFRCPKKIFSPNEPVTTANAKPLQTASSFQKSSSALSQKKKLELKQENVDRAKATESSKMKSCREQLSQYAKENFLVQRKPLINKVDKNQHNQESFTNPLASKSLFNERNSDVSGDEETNTQKENLPKGQETENNETNSEWQAQFDDNGNNGASVTPRRRLFPQTGDGLQHDDQRQAKRPRVPRDQLVHKPVRYFRERAAPIAPQLNEEEKAINLFVTPEAEIVDPNNKARYQEIGDMIYLGEGKAVDKKFWEFLKIRGETIFLRETAELICGKYNLVNRCIKPSKTSVVIRGRSPRKVISPSKYHCIRELFKDHLNEKKFDDAKKGRFLRNFNRDIGLKIKDLRKRLLEEEDADENI